MSLLDPLPELTQLQALIERGAPHLSSEIVCEVNHRGRQWPVHCLELGSRSRDVPAVGFFGGIHGVERIGTQVLLSYLHTLVEGLHWDDDLARWLETVRLVFMPLVNPGGMLQQTRCNPAGVDLMRNAPVDADHDVPMLLGGQRLSPRLPWYRGAAGEPMQPEAQALCRVVEERLIGAPFSLAIDCHSGFGLHDRIWFPYARSREPIDCLAEIYALRSLFRATHPHHHIYIIEPQSKQYTTHGDLWDYLYDKGRERGEGLFVPFTLEMGSWLWLKKNPIQLFQLHGLFNPILPHRQKRTLRRHLTLLDFLMRAAISHRRWRPTEEQRPMLHGQALAYWSAPPKQR